MLLTNMLVAFHPFLARLKAFQVTTHVTITLPDVTSRIATCQAPKIGPMGNGNTQKRNLKDN